MYCIIDLLIINSKPLSKNCNMDVSIFFESSKLISIFRFDFNWFEFRDTVREKGHVEGGGSKFGPAIFRFVLQITIFQFNFWGKG